MLDDEWLRLGCFWQDSLMLGYDEVLALQAQLQGKSRLCFNGRARFSYKCLYSGSLSSEARLCALLQVVEHCGSAGCHCLDVASRQRLQLGQALPQLVCFVADAGKCRGTDKRLREEDVRHNELLLGGTALLLLASLFLVFLRSFRWGTEKR